MTQGGTLQVHCVRRMDIGGVHLKRRAWWMIAACSAAAPAAHGAEQQAAATPQVVVAASQADAQSRRDFVAGKIIIGRKRIEDSGADNVAELLKREPAVSVSADGRVGLMGLPGYTQVLVDGAPPEQGKGIEQLNLVHVEKVEIIKSAVAEYGPFGIAGTINIVTRKAQRKTSTELGLGASMAGSRPGISATLSHNQSQAGSPWRAGTNVSAGHSRTASDSTIRLSSRPTGQAEQTIWQGDAHVRGRSSNADASAELAWDPGTGHFLRLSPNGGQSRNRDAALETRSYADGRDTRAHIVTHSVFSMASLPFQWTFKPEARSQLELRAVLSRVGLDVSERRTESGDGPGGMREHAREALARTGRFELAYKARLGKRHDVKLGASALHTRETIDYINRIDGQPDSAFSFVGNHQRGFSRQTRLYAQDDWRVTGALALNAGLSGQHTALGVDEGTFDSASRFRLWSPSLHLLYKLDEDDTRQVRVSLARSFRAPGRDELALRPRINPLAPCTLAACGANSVDTLDSAGNPQLRPERSLGLNLAYEHGLGGDSTLTVEAYARRISGKTGTGIALENIAWSSLPRYVSRPANLGDARVHGVNIEMDLALRDVSKNAPRLNLRGSINLARSRVDSLPGPDNRLDRQTPWSAKLGGSYAPPAWPLKIDVDANWSPGVWIRSNQSLRIAIPRRFNLDSSLVWTVAPGKRMRLGVADLVPRTAQSRYEYESSDGLATLWTDAEKVRTVTLRLDTKL